MKREQIDFNKVVNIAEDGEITVLDYVFDHGNGFKGATGTRFYPVSKKYYNKRTTIAAIAEHLEGCIREDELKYPSYKSWAKAIKQAGEDGEFMFDQSYSGSWDMLREVSGLNEDEAFIFECTGGGRCFDKNYQGNVNPELSAVIREFEG